MWIKITKNYPGRGKLIKGLTGLSYQQGREHDLPDGIAKVLLKNNFAEKIPAPWEKNLNPLMPQIQQFQKAFAKIRQDLAKNKGILRNAAEIAATIPALEERIKSQEQEQTDLQAAIIKFADKNNIPVKDIVDGIQTLQTDPAEKTTQDAGNAPGQAAPPKQTEE